jgi:hypothetical protein
VLRPRPGQIADFGSMSMSNPWGNPIDRWIVIQDPSRETTCLYQHRQEDPTVRERFGKLLIRSDVAR